MNEDTTELDDVTPKNMPGDDDPDGLTAADVLSKDGLLDLLLGSYVGWKDDGHGHVGLTVQSGGVVISGVVISRTEWITRLAQSLRESGTAEFADNLEASFGRIQRDLAEEWDRRDQADLLGRARRFIHMRDVRVLATPSVDLPLWRGALADITGWSLGSWNPPAAIEHED